MIASDELMSSSLSLRCSLSRRRSRHGRERNKMPPDVDLATRLQQIVLDGPTTPSTRRTASTSSFTTATAATTGTGTATYDTGHHSRAPWSYMLIRWLFQFVMNVFYANIVVEGAHKWVVPDGTPCVLTANHSNSLTDALLLVVTVPSWVSTVLVPVRFGFKLIDGFPFMGDRRRDGIETQADSIDGQGHSIWSRYFHFCKSARTAPPSWEGAYAPQRVVILSLMCWVCVRRLFAVT